MNMGYAKMLPIVCVALITVCHGARISQQLPQTTTTLIPMPTVSRIPMTISMVTDIATIPSPPECIDDTNPQVPLGKLRKAMRSSVYMNTNPLVDAFLIFYSDEHLSEEPSPDERRLEYISGWDGAGTAAVVAEGGAAVWVPNGELKRARATFSCAWLVLDADDPSQPTIAEWLSERVGRNGRVGGDSRLASVVEWQALSSSLQRESLQLINIHGLIDQLWREEPDMDRRRPEFIKTVANEHGLQYAGVSWREKVTAVRNELRAVGADGMIVTALDEVAWLLNVRGLDLPHAPLLKAFVVIGVKDVRIFAPPGKLPLRVREALDVSNCLAHNNNCTRVMEYTTIYTELRRLPESKILVPAPGTFQRGASAYIFQTVQASKRVFQLSPIIYLKAQKNEAETKGMRRAHLRDAVAMCTLLNYLEGKTGLTEMSITKKVDITRETQAAFLSTSIKTRVSFGPNAAEPEYQPTNRTNRKIFKNATLVIQSGGQYIEGTTVVTRTVHFGTPTREDRRAYTTVLRALGALAILNTPGMVPAAHADPVARAPLWAAGQDYPHPTGHGVGAALNRREDPVVIDYRQDTNLHTFKEGYFITSEPGWYDPDKFGVRLGNVLEVIGKPNGYLAFREATLVPYEPKLIDRSMLTEYEITWLNSYNDRIRKTVGPELKDQGLMDVYFWMMNKTVPMELPSKMKKTHSSSSGSFKCNWILLPLMLFHIKLINYF